MFRWIFGKKEQNIKNNVNGYLHGVSLDEWTYLGCSEINFVNDNNEIEKTAYVFFFCKENDISKRKYILKHNKYFNFESHTWSLKHLPLWEIGEKHIYELIQNPSEFLEEYMLKEYASVWDENKDQWIKNEKSKYDSAVINNKKDKKKTEINDNVVKIEFKKE